MGGTSYGHWLVIIILFSPFLLPALRRAINKNKPPRYACTACQKTCYDARTSGSIAIEMVLWVIPVLLIITGLLIPSLFVFAFIFGIPALVYSIWRLTKKHTQCPHCKHETLVPIDSPRAQAMDTKPCPECAEPVLSAAKKCKHCGSQIG